jgi:hypothetical protein
MPRARRLCRRGPHPAEPGRNLCAEHQREYEAERGSRQARGYDAEHVKARARWASLVAKGVVRCRRCGEVIEPNTPWHLGHDDARTSSAPEHEDCNLRAAGLKAQGRQWSPGEGL